MKRELTPKQLAFALDLKAKALKRAKEVALNPIIIAEGTKAKLLEEFAFLQTVAETLPLNWWLDFGTQNPYGALCQEIKYPAEERGSVICYGERVPAATFRRNGALFYRTDFSEFGTPFEKARGWRAETKFDDQ